jgi:hypothetical protein
MHSNVHSFVVHSFVVHSCVCVLCFVFVLFSFLSPREFEREGRQKLHWCGDAVFSGWVHWAVEFGLVLLG